ncbi:MAG: 16S rRNA (cytosine(1402)-N(4))-methyltransferase RsmH [Candidatus Azosocius agrarius]|nr:MAG: 16S rRNA (cytosine(1402)-N(4))-methyltransferase RsmH [Gammaproteobacteria bacterium]
MKHKSIMKNFITNYLINDTDGIYVDATFGQGGHTKNILKIMKNSKLLIIDKDYESITLAYKFSKIDKRIAINHDSYKNIKNIYYKNNITKNLSSIFLDLGISSSQIDNHNRGFSFFNDGPLDMRMNITSKITAYNWINTINKKILNDTLKNFGEKQYKSITENILKNRKISKINTTKTLCNIIKNTNNKSNYDPNITFFAIRNTINNENNDLKIFFTDIINLLKNDGIIIILYFNSFEYNLLKHYINEINENETIENCYKLKKINLKKKITYKEITNNIRARSANIIILKKIKYK